LIVLSHPDPESRRIQHVALGTTSTYPASNGYILSQPSIKHPIQNGQRISPSYWDNESCPFSNQVQEESKILVGIDTNQEYTGRNCCDPVVGESVAIGSNRNLMEISNTLGAIEC
jgi:hypothetical protein